MNKDINKTLMALVPILKMNGENVTNIEAVHDWYKVGDREYMKEVAEITYDNGTVRYADIGCDSNLTAIYDVIAVIQQIKPRSKAIERIERGVYSLPSAQPEERTEERTETHSCDLIDRQAAMEEISKQQTYKMFAGEDTLYLDANDVGSILASLPSAQPEYRLDEWCTNCKEYDKEKHCCPRFNRVIQTTLQEMQSERKKGKWVWSDEDASWKCGHCDCVFEEIEWRPEYNYCPNCGADMRGEDDGTDKE